MYLQITKFGAIIVMLLSLLYFIRFQLAVLFDCVLPHQIVKFVQFIYYFCTEICFCHVSN